MRAFPYGNGDGSTTFKLPDDRGLFTRGKAASGRAIGSYERDGVQPHLHGILYAAGPLAGGSGGNNIFGGASIGNTELSAGTETRPINRAYLPIIKYQ